MPNSLKYRRRQVYMGLFVLLLSVFSVSEGMYFRHQDHVQRQCVSAALAHFSDVLGLRGTLVDRETANTNRIIERVFKAKSRAEALAAYHDYSVEEQAIQKLRNENPVPDYSPGACDGQPRG